MRITVRVNTCVAKVILCEAQPFAAGACANRNGWARGSVKPGDNAEVRRASIETAQTGTNAESQRRHGAAKQSTCTKLAS